jgi:hypothetical protein
MIEHEKQQLLGGHAVERLRLHRIATKPAKFRSSNSRTQLCDIIIVGPPITRSSRHVGVGMLIA